MPNSASIQILNFIITVHDNIKRTLPLLMLVADYEHVAARVRAAFSQALLLQDYLEHRIANP